MLISSRLIQTSAQALLVLLATAVGVYSLRYALPHVPAPAPLTNVTTQHVALCVHDYALTSAAITLRIYLGIILGFGIPFVPGYQIIAWLCWLPNLLVAEFLLNRTGGNYWVGDQNAG